MSVPFVIQKHPLPMPVPRANHVAVTWNDATIIWGGFGDYKSTIHYHLSGVWHKVETSGEAPGKVHNGDVQVVDDKMFVLQGRNSIIG